MADFQVKHSKLKMVRISNRPRQIMNRSIWLPNLSVGLCRSISEISNFINSKLLWSALEKTIPDNPHELVTSIFLKNFATGTYGWCMYSMYVCLCVQLYACMCVCGYVCASVCVRFFVYLPVHVCACVCVCLPMYVSVCVWERGSTGVGMGWVWLLSENYGSWTVSKLDEMLWRPFQESTCFLKWQLSQNHSYTSLSEDKFLSSLNVTQCIA